MDLLKNYVDLFNAQDKEIYKTDITNAMAYAWLKEEIPLLECPDKVIEKTYYYRWWVYRKHIKNTPKGSLISEFLPKVPWSGAYNTIVAAAGHHISEGRWLKHGEKYLNDYINLFLECSEDAFHYSTWLLTAISDLYAVKPFEIRRDFMEKICKYYEVWENTHKTECGLYWSYDDRDAMEFSISGTRNMQCTKGIRPTLNSYMYGNALAIANFAHITGSPDLENKYKVKADTIRKQMNKLLWRENFYKAIHPQQEIFTNIDTTSSADVPRELIGYIPWIYNIPETGKEDVFDFLTDKNVFYTDIGLTTAEQSDRRFLFESEHECLWNGYIWPFATTQTLSALRNVIFYYGKKEKYSSVFVQLLHQYAAQHTRKTSADNNIMWIDEVMHPYKYEWTSRTLLEKLGWRSDKGGIERGKDYNHSAFCDLVISGLAGIKVNSGVVEIEPLFPKEWDYFKMENIIIDGNSYCVLYDRNGNHYNFGKGLTVLINGIKQDIL